MIYYNYAPHYPSTFNKYSNVPYYTPSYPNRIPKIPTNKVPINNSTKNNMQNRKNSNINHSNHSNINFKKDNTPFYTNKSLSKEEPIDEQPLFEIFGIKLYFDDILLICLIFFLYNEGVQDQYLFIALILLLLS